MPNPTTINEAQSMNISETITRLRELLAKATPGEWAAGHFGTDHSCQCRYVLGETCSGSICDVSVDNGKRIANGGNDSPPAGEAAANLQLIPAMKNALPQLLNAIEARESEKAREWWRVGERKPTTGSYVLLWTDQVWVMRQFVIEYETDYWLDDRQFNALPNHIWRLMPEAPVIGEGKS